MTAAPYVDLCISFFKEHSALLPSLFRQRFFCHLHRNNLYISGSQNGTIFQGTLVST